MIYPPHREIGLDETHYFPLGDVRELAARLQLFERMRWPVVMRDSTRRWVAERYDWRSAVKQTIGVYRRAARGGEVKFRNHRTPAE